MRLCLVSFFNSANLGDMLISHALHELAAEFGEVERISFSGEPFETPDLNALPASPATVRGPSHSMRSRIASTRAGQLAWSFRQSRRESHDRMRGMMESADLVLIGGGNMIFDVERRTRSADRFEYFVNMARGVKRPAAGIALGIGPFSTVSQHRGACHVLDKCAALTFRDESSLALYSQYGTREAHVSIDPVLTMPQRTERRRLPTGRIAWNIIEPAVTGGYSGSARDDLLRVQANALRELISSGHAVELFTTDRADESALRDLAAMVDSSKCTVRPIGGISDLLSLYGEADLVIACRMHALIVAATQGLPIIGLSWQTKVASFFKTLGRLSQCFDFDRVLAGTLRDVVERATADPAEYSLSQGDLRRLGERQDVDRRMIAELMGR